MWQNLADTSCLSTKNEGIDADTSHPAHSTLWEG